MMFSHNSYNKPNCLSGEAAALHMGTMVKRWRSQVQLKLTKKDWYFLEMGRDGRFHTEGANINSWMPQFVRTRPFFARGGKPRPYEFSRGLAAWTLITQGRDLGVR
jgi:hypothetical protein